MKKELEQLFGGFMDYVGMEEGNIYYERVGSDAKPTHDIKIAKEGEILFRVHGQSIWNAFSYDEMKAIRNQ